MKPPAAELNTRPRRSLAVAVAAFALLTGCDTAPPRTPTNPPGDHAGVAGAASGRAAGDVSGGASGGAAPDAPPAAGPRAVYPGVVLNREAGYVDLRGRVVGRTVDWLELLACRPGTREYESVVTLDAEAAHLQLALILLGLEPGEPARAERTDGGVEFFAPHGPAVELFFVLDDQPDGLIPAHTWIVDQETGQVMPGNTWLFVGSRTVDHAGKRWFLAEENGTLISLVNFGDELIGRGTDQSADGGNVLWTANTDVIPPEGTRLTLRIRPAPAPNP